MAFRARRTRGGGSAASITRTNACDRLPRCGRSAAPMSNSDWSIERSLQLYNIPGWGIGYFSINPKGHLVVHPFGQPGPVIDLMDVVDDIRERKLGFPCVVRFQDLLRSRVKQLNDVFRNAIAQHGYKGQYFGVYPTKVNQMREVVEEILDAGAPWHFGLEAGSKGELLRAAGKVEAAKLFHFHVGSQLTDIRTVKDVVNEGARFYAEAASDVEILQAGEPHLPQLGVFRRRRRPRRRLRGRAEHRPRF